ncbi:MAG: hypothetical protein GY789_03650 [Hyphomicrobiales bacterium]|nr:hypothetical protein [Hyphomicrobiales bacterium]MCP4997239.1 hypothetical protein [Hyphomicrobiales bacterium]
MQRTARKKPLYRKENTRTHGVHHGGGAYRWARNSVAEKRSDAKTGSMHARLRHGLDYTPLFRFLLSRVGSDWSQTHSEAVARLDTPDPIYWIVALRKADRKPFVLIGESTYFSGLCVDEDNRLALVDPDLCVEDMIPSCACCTHTFNGKLFVREYSER